MQLGDFFGHAQVSGTIVTGSTNVRVLPANAGRVKTIFQSHSLGAWFIKFGDDVSITDFTVKLASGSRYVAATPGVHSGTYSVVQGSGSGPLYVTEFSVPEIGY